MSLDGNGRKWKKSTKKSALTAAAGAAAVLRTSFDFTPSKFVAVVAVVVAAAAAAAATGVAAAAAAAAAAAETSSAAHAHVLKILCLTLEDLVALPYFVPFTDASRKVVSQKLFCSQITSLRRVSTISNGWKSNPINSHRRLLSLSLVILSSFFFINS